MVTRLWSVAPGTGTGEVTGGYRHRWVEEGGALRCVFCGGRYRGGGRSEFSGACPGRRPFTVEDALWLVALAGLTYWLLT